jgi:hypothetical protein
VVLRAKHDLNFAPRGEETPLDEQDRAAGVISDRVGRLTGSPHCKAPRQEVREVLVADPDRPERAGDPLITTILDLAGARDRGPVPVALADRAVLSAG